ncbi:hypothetical protein A1O1_04368 [Capronia coronata CBS 617.96]|uniref:A1 cistron-splicing factor AAR2 n=1 Tax=Capronia coronata CBS 617.96 TaxID=1182541 RepID=W9YFC5_9EURO|nr:uncharacterized protein A1O1_04368 [Capronia coronata CBS 617.96]EXJ91258.1 hypothetical protein A1O1_04368 [Capronia coronata CBS 617.96]
MTSHTTIQSQSNAPTLLLLSLPPKTLIGIDLLSFNSAPNFHGITNIPYGVHFVYTGTHASLSIRHGRWLHLAPGGPPSQVLRWNSDTELLELLDHDSQTARNAIAAVSSRGLVDYTALQDATSDLATRESEADSASGRPSDERSESTDWPKLSSYISARLFDRVLSPEWAVSSVSSAPSDTEHIPGLSHLETTNALHQLPLNLLPIDLKQTWESGDIGRTRTERARDRSWYLAQLVDSLTPPNGDRALGAKEVLAELQFCFLMILTLSNYSCLEQWKRLLGVLLTCQSALVEVEAFFVEVVKILDMQMRHVDDVEGGLFEMRDEGASPWLRSIWGRFRALVDEAFAEEKEKGKALRKAVETLQKLFEDKYGWQSERDILRRGMVQLEDGESVELTMQGADEDDEAGEYAPVVVDT